MKIAGIHVKQINRFRKVWGIGAEVTNAEVAEMILEMQASQEQARAETREQMRKAQNPVEPKTVTTVSQLKGGTVVESPVPMGALSEKARSLAWSPMHRSWAAHEAASEKLEKDVAAANAARVEAENDPELVAVREALKRMES